MNEQYQDSTNEISLFDLYHIIRKNILLILFFTGIFFVFTTFYAFTIAETKYKSNADIMIQVEVNPDTNTFDYVTAQRLITTIAELMSKDVIINQALENLDTELTANNFKRNLTVSSSSTSFFISISYLSEDPEFSRDAVNEIINAAIFITNNDPSFSSLANKLSRTSNAQLGIYDSPNRLLYMVIGVILGGIVGLGVVFIKEFFKNTFGTKEQLEAAFGIQVLGIIPKFETKEKKVNGKKR